MSYSPEDVVERIRQVLIRRRCGLEDVDSVEEVLEEAAEWIELLLENDGPEG